MRSGASIRPDYTRAEKLSDAVIHFAGLVLVLAAVPALWVVTAHFRGDARSVFGVTIYGTAFFAMLLFSALYNLVTHPRWAGLLKRLDHSAIYVKIAGTYTPFTLISGHGGGLVAAVWSAAALGVALKFAAPGRFRWPALALYLGMGWAGVIAGQSMLSALPASVVVLMIVGGCLYTMGVAFLLYENLPFHYTIWHVFVLAASFVFYAAVTVLVLAA